MAGWIDRILAGPRGWAFVAALLGVVAVVGGGIVVVQVRAAREAAEQARRQEAHRALCEAKCPGGSRTVTSVLGEGSGPRYEEIARMVRAELDALDCPCDLRPMDYGY